MSKGNASLLRHSFQVLFACIILFSFGLTGVAIILFTNPYQITDHTLALVSCALILAAYLISFNLVTSITQLNNLSKAKEKIDKKATEAKLKIARVGDLFNQLNKYSFIE